MNRKYILQLSIIAIVVSLFLGFLFSKNSVSKEIAKKQDKPIIKTEAGQGTLCDNVEHSGGRKSIEDAYNADMVMYGRVVDQNKNPISGAVVKIIPNSDPGGESSGSFFQITDTLGNFSVKGIKGLSLGIEVAKEGFMSYPVIGDSDSGVFSAKRIDFGLLSDRGKIYNDPKRPVVFTLRSVSEDAPIIFIPRQSWALPIGEERSIALDAKNGEGAHRLIFCFDSKSKEIIEAGGGAYDEFDWSFEISVPGGGIKQYYSDGEFEAPIDGYGEVFRLVNKAGDVNWERISRRRFFVKFSDGSYARVRVTVDGLVGRKPLALVSWLCGKPGIRNLSSVQKDSAIWPDKRD